VFTEIPGGRIIGTLFFLLLVVAATTPSIALLEPVAAWLMRSGGVSRAAAVWIIGVSSWVLGIGSVLSFNRWSQWYPLSFIPLFAHKTLFDVLDYASSNIMMPIGALLTSILVGWRVSTAFARDELAHSSPPARTACVWLLRYVCPLAILAVLIATLV
jgi:NSS family neurotransmitter:Na+ symporter